MNPGPLAVLAGITSLLFVPAMILVLIVKVARKKPFEYVLKPIGISCVCFIFMAFIHTELVGAIVIICHLIMIYITFMEHPSKKIDNPQTNIKALTKTVHHEIPPLSNNSIIQEELSSFTIETTSATVDVSKDSHHTEETYQPAVVKPEIVHDEHQTEIEIDDLTPCESSTLVFTRDDIFGRTIEEHYDYYRALKNIKSVDINTVGSDLHTELIKIDSMDGLTFEQYTANLLTLNGFVDTKTTQSTNDYGVDAIAFRHGDKYAIQCKNYSSTLGNSPVQEVYTGMAHYNASKAAVITNSYFTENAKKLAVDNSVELWDRDVLIKFINNAIPKVDKMDQVSTPEEMEYSNLFNESVEYTLTKLNISTSDLQRTFDITFLESTKLFNDLRALGIIENLDSLRPSNVIITPEAISDRFYRYKI